jgi:hypothetical protein
VSTVPPHRHFSSETSFYEGQQRHFVRFSSQRIVSESSEKGLKNGNKTAMVESYEDAQGQGSAV